MDTYPTNATTGSASVTETRITETISLSQQPPSVSSVKYMNPTPIVTISPSSVNLGFVYTSINTKTELSSSTTTESSQQPSLTEPIQPSPAKSEEAVQKSDGNDSRARSRGIHVGIGVSVGVFIGVLCFISVWYLRIRKRKKKNHKTVVENRPSPVGVIAELDGGWRPPRRRRSTLRRSLRDSWYLVLQRNQSEDVPPLPKPPADVDPEMSFLDLTPSETKSKYSITKDVTS
ncbi:hypothetical protein F4810DRAFT_27732 [Camillea tinctor]|nr:hypothetical protein F4810DRAFT_27732 [Camillea tinctor]